MRIALLFACVSVLPATALADVGNRLDFLVYGDTRDFGASHRQLVDRMAQEPADLVLHTGDIVSAGSDDAAWKTFLAADAPLLAKPFHAVAGNHEYAGDPTLSSLQRFLPAPTPATVVGEHTGVAVGASGTLRYYAFHEANALFIALDSNHSNDPLQAAWLSGTLHAADSDPAVRHVFVFFHHPPFSVGDMCGHAVEDGLWLPEFVHHRVRAVFVGHSHSYQHLERRGVRYFVSGGGGAPLDRDLGDCQEWDREALITYRSEHHFLRVRVRGDDVSVEAIDSAGGRIERVDGRNQALNIGAVVHIPFYDAPPHRDSAILKSYAIKPRNSRPFDYRPYLAVTALLLLWALIRIRRYASASMISSNSLRTDSEILSPTVELTRSSAAQRSTRAGLGGAVLVESSPASSELAMLVPSTAKLQ